MLFTIRTSLPEKGNKLYNNASGGGWSGCITGYPTYNGLDVLSNCVGWACSRFNEIYNEITGYNGMKFPDLSCNAENFPERAQKYYGLEFVSKPTLGGIMVFQKGTLDPKDGAGHVMIVEQILERDANGNPTKVFTSESAYGGATFYNATRTNENGRWGMGSAYSYRGCIKNPAVKEETITPTVERDTHKNQLKILEDMNIRTGAGTNYASLGITKGGIYNWYETKENQGYTWYRIAENQWVAQDSTKTYLEIYYKEEDKEVEELKKRIAELEAINKELDEKNKDLEKEIEIKDKQIDEIIKKITEHKDQFNIEKDGEYFIELKGGEILSIKSFKDTKYTLNLCKGDIVQVR